MDALDGLAALEQVVETIGEQLDDLYQRRDIPQAERVTLRTLEWTLAKLADDLHTMRNEFQLLRLSVAAAQKLDLQRLGDMSRIAKERHELRAQAERKPWMEWQPPANVDKLYKRIPGDAIMVHKLLGGDDLPALYEAGWRYLPITPENELTKKAGELPAETYQWQVGDLVMMGHAELSSGKPRKVSAVHPRGVFLEGYESGHAQAEWERNGWKLYRYRKGSDLGVQQLTPRQVEISDSTGTDGEGQQVAEPAEREWAVGDNLVSKNTGIVWTIHDKTGDGVTLQHAQHTIFAAVDTLKKRFKFVEGTQVCNCSEQHCPHPRKPATSDSTGTDGEGQP